MLRHGLIRDLAWVLAVKVIVLAVVFVLFFGPGHQPPTDLAAHIGGNYAIPLQAAGACLNGDKHGCR